MCMSMISVFRNPFLRLIQVVTRGSYPQRVTTHQGQAPCLNLCENCQSHPKLL